jgi:hypothetical protein
MSPNELVAQAAHRERVCRVVERSPWPAGGQQP